MIKFLLSSLFLLSINTFSGFAQKQIFIGAKGGLSIPNLRAGETKNEWNKDYTSRIGPHFGLFTEIPLNKHFSLVPELNFSGQGGKRNTIQPMTIPEQYLEMFQIGLQTDKDYIFANLNNTSRINYLQLPIHLKYSTPIALKKRLSMHAQVGPYIGYMISGKQIVHQNNLKVYMDAAGTKEIPANLVADFFGTSVDTTIDAKQDLYHWNYGVSGALGFSYQCKKGKIVLEGGGNYGLRYIQKGDEHGKNRIGAGMVVLGYAYPFNCKKKA